MKFDTRVLGVDPGDAARAIRAAGGIPAAPRGLHTQWLFDWLDGTKKHWLSVRGGDRGPGTLAVTSNNGHEVTVRVSNVDNALRLLSELGYDFVSAVVMFRSPFRLGGARIALDEAPGVPPWLEITGPDLDTVAAAAARLGYSPDRHAPLSVIQAYRRYGIDVLGTADASR